MHELKKLNKCNNLEDVANEYENLKQLVNQIISFISSNQHENITPVNNEVELFQKKYKMLHENQNAFITKFTLAKYIDHVNESCIDVINERLDKVVLPEIVKILEKQKDQLQAQLEDDKAQDRNSKEVAHIAREISQLDDEKIQEEANLAALKEKSSRISEHIGDDLRAKILQEREKNTAEAKKADTLVLDILRNKHYIEESRLGEHLWLIDPNMIVDLVIYALNRDMINLVDSLYAILPRGNKLTHFQRRDLLSPCAKNSTRKNQLTSMLDKNIALTDEEKNTAFHECISSHNLVGVELMAALIDVNFRFNNITPIFAAIQAQFENCCIYFLKRNTQTSELDKEYGTFSLTPLELAEQMAYNATNENMTEQKILALLKEQRKINRNAVKCNDNFIAAFRELNRKTIDISALKKLNIDKETVNRRNLKGFTLLHLALIRQNVDLCKYLLSIGADVNILFPITKDNTDGPTYSIALKSEDKIPFSPLLYTGMTSNELFELLITRSEVKLTYVYDNCTISALSFFSSNNCDSSIIRAVLSKMKELNIDINQERYFRKPALLCAAMNNRADLCELFLAHGANKTDTVKISDRAITPYEAALEQGHNIQALALTNLNTTLSQLFHCINQIPFNLSQFKTLLDGWHSRKDFNNYNLHGHTLLSCAAKLGHTDAANQLLRKGADANKSSYYHEAEFPNGKTPLHISIENNKPSICKLLLQNNAQLLTEGSIDTKSSLYYAVELNKTEIIQILLDEIKKYAEEKKIRILNHLYKGKTVLCLAAEMSSLSLCTQLVRMGANTDLGDIPPSSIVIRNGNPEILSILKPQFSSCPERKP